MILKRNKRKEVVAAHYVFGASIRTSIPSGKHYSYEEDLGDGLRAWTHEPLIHFLDTPTKNGADTAEALDQHVRDIFRGVLHSVTAKPAKAKVVSIDAFRKRRLEQPKRAA